MITDKKFSVEKDTENKKILVTRIFDAPLSTVWRAWTDPEILDQWWAPKPYFCSTKSMDFTEGGHWHYSMVGPESSDKHWSMATFGRIDRENYFTYRCVFCDEAGNTNKDMASMHWLCRFTAIGDVTKVEIELSFDTIESMNKMIAMGFEQGFTMGLNNLEELLSH